MMSIAMSPEYLLYYLPLLVAVSLVLAELGMNMANSFCDMPSHMLSGLPVFMLIVAGFIGARHVVCLAENAVLVLVLKNADGGVG